MVPGLITASSRRGPKHSLLEVGKGRPRSIIQLSKMSTPRCDLFGTILFFLNHCLIPGWFPLLRPSSSSVLHPPCVHALLVQFPFLSPEVLTAAFIKINK